MRLLEQLHEGEKFRVAHSGQLSKNGIEIGPREVLYVEKIFLTSPYMRICRLFNRRKDRRVRSLLPSTPVVSPTAAQPTVEQVEEFLLGSRPRRMASRYVLNWAGERVDHLLQPQELRVLEALRDSGIKEFRPKDVTWALKDVGLQGKLSARRVFNHYARHYCELGLLSAIVDEKPSATRTLKDVVGCTELSDGVYKNYEN